MNRLPSELRSTPPSPRTDSVTSRPRTDSGQTMCLGVAVLARVFLLQRDQLLLQGADHLQPGPVADVREPRVLVAAEVALADLAVRCAVEQRAPGLQLPDPVRRLLGMQLGHPPVV